MTLAKLKRNDVKGALAVYEAALDRGINEDQLGELARILLNMQDDQSALMDAFEALADDYDL